MATNMLTIFNQQFEELLNDIQSVFPEDPDILAAQKAILTIKKMNPKLLVKIWKKYVYIPYQSYIDNGDISFFLEKDYSNDLSKNDNAEAIMEAINRLRNPVKQMSIENKSKVMKYIQNLSKLCLLVPQ
jgi:hypothetical protein